MKSVFRLIYHIHLYSTQLEINSYHIIIRNGQDTLAFGKVQEVLLSQRWAN